MRKTIWSKLNRHSDEIFDVVLMRQDINDNFIRKIGEPFYVHMGSKYQLEVLKLNYKYDNIIYIDATGTIVRTPKSCKSKLLYYAATIKINNVICPVTTMLNCRHTTAAISDWLMEFKYYCKEGKVWPPCKQVITDVSYASINAILASWNILGTVEIRKNDSLLQYLIACYKHLTENTEFNLIILRFC